MELELSVEDMDHVLKFDGQLGNDTLDLPKVHVSVCKTLIHPIPPPDSMLFFQSTYHCTLKTNAQLEPTLNRGRTDLHLGIRCLFEASVQHF